MILPIFQDKQVLLMSLYKLNFVSTKKINKMAQFEQTPIIWQNSNDYIDFSQRFYYNSLKYKHLEN